MSQVFHVSSHCVYRLVIFFSWALGFQIKTGEASRGFQSDTENIKLTSSVGDLLLLTRSRDGREFVPTSKSYSSAHHPRLKSLDKIKNTVNRQSQKKQSLVGVQTSFHQELEHPVMRADILALENELKDRIRAVMFTEDEEIKALESGQLYQPNKDKLLMAKHRLLNEMHVDESKYDVQPWLHRMVKCESLNQICDDVASKLTDMLSVSATDMGNVLRHLRSVYRQSFDEIRNCWKLLHEKFSETEATLHENNKQLAEFQRTLQENEAVSHRNSIWH